MTDMVVLNLGCGYRTSPRCTNIDWSIPIRLRGSRIGRRLAPLILQGERRAAYEAMDGSAMCHDLRKGIPFEDQTVDVVYHSHMLEHLDRDVVPALLAEIRRVLRPGGTHRIVVPDLEAQARTYLATLEGNVSGTQTVAVHEAAVHDLIEQMVRRESYGTSLRSKGRRHLENAVLGDARKRGETHQWMWDRVSLPHQLLLAGFSVPKVVSYSESRIPDWPGFLLDQEDDGSEYRPGSLYVEASA